MRFGRNFRRGGSPQKTPTQRAIAFLRSLGSDAHVWLPGVGSVNGLYANNYILSDGSTGLAPVDQYVGLVKDAMNPASGVPAIQATTANKPRVIRGALNLLSYSQDFSNAVWAGDSATKTTGYTDPSGGNTAGRFVINSGSFYPRNTSYSLVAGVTYIFSIYLRNFIAPAAINLSIYDGAWRKGQAITLTSDFVRSTFTFTAAGSSSVGCGVYIAGASGNGFEAAFAQLEIGSVASAYSPTTSAAASNPNAGPYSWVFDSTDSLTATLPAGWEAATTIDAKSTGQVTLQNQNIVGAYSVGPSLTTSGRIVLRTSPTSEKLALLQNFANQLAGL